MLQEEPQPDPEMREKKISTSYSSQQRTPDDENLQLCSKIRTLNTHTKLNPEEQWEVEHNTMKLVRC